MSNTDPSRARKSAILQIIGGFLILVASGMSAQSGVRFWQTLIGTLVGAYFLGFGIYRYSILRDE